VCTFKVYAPSSSPQSVAAPIDKIPVFQRGGTIVPRMRRLRRSSSLMRRDPYTLTVIATAGGTANGHLYQDDGESFAYQQGACTYRSLSLENNRLSNSAVSPSSCNPVDAKYTPENTVERLVVVGLKKEPSQVRAVTDGGDSKALTFTMDTQTKALTVRKPDLRIASDWTVEFIF